MERRTALVAAVATGTSLAIGVVAFAAVGGAPILGLGGGSTGKAAVPVVVHQVVTVDDPVMVSTRPTDVPREVVRGGETPAVAPLGIAASGGDGITVSIGSNPTTAVVTGSTTPVGGTAPSPPVTAAAAPSSPNSVTLVPATTTPSSTESTTAATTPTTTLTTTATPTPTPTTTAPTPTTAARPPGVPSDWPAGTPIPPMPADCQKPQLEDNGVWNCDH